MAYDDRSVKPMSASLMRARIVTKILSGLYEEVPTMLTSAVRLAVELPGGKGHKGPPYSFTIGASPAYSFTAHVAEVAVDRETGITTVEKVWIAHDCGKALNPVIVEGQMEGSAYMGFAEALMEEQTYDAEGRHRGPSLLDYRIPTTLDTPELVSLIVESHDPEGPYGAKEAGEGPLHPVIPAIANAIFHAVGVRLRRIPFHPGLLLKALRESGSTVGPRW